jgi:hypothetical protein
VSKRIDDEERLVFLSILRAISRQVEDRRRRELDVANAPLADFMRRRKRRKRRSNV